MEQTYCGSVAIVGRPNVGKSTLMNAILGEKLSITSRKPQTTRHRILGVKTTEPYQTIYLDTPGFHKNTPHRLNRAMNRTVMNAIQEVNAIVLVTDCRQWTDEDDLILKRLQQQSLPVILVINKTDTISDKLQLLPLIQAWSTKMNFAAVVPLSALKINNVTALEQALTQYLPAGPYVFATDDLTDCSDTFLATELIREKIMRLLEEEVPYSTTVQIEKFDVTDNLIRIAALIWVERDGQKAIIIGEKGSMLKKIGQLAREDMEALFEKKVFLHLWVKVKSGWSDDEQLLRKLNLS